MRFQCPRKLLSDSVNLANLAVATRSALPIFTSLKLEAKEGYLRVIGCDQSIWIERTIQCSVEEEGAVCIAAKTLADVVNALPDGEVLLETGQGQFAKLSLGNSEYQLAVIDAEDFIDVPPIPSEQTITLPMKSLTEAIESVAIAISPESHRQVLTGVLFTVKDEILKLVATDTHRLAVKTIAFENPIGELTAVVSEKALKAIRSLPPSDEANVDLHFGNSQFGIERSGIRIVAQLIQGTFPAWERIIPSTPTRVWTLENGQLADDLRRVMIIAKDSANRVKFEGDGGTVTITARSEDRGDAHEETPVVADNGDIAIAFNGKYVQDFLAVVDAPDVRLEMTENSRPALFKTTAEAGDYLYVVMPMQI